LHLATPVSPSRAPSLATLASAAATICVASILCVPAVSAAAPVTQTFSSPTNTGTSAAYVVPAGVTSIQVEAVGAKGGDVPAALAPFGGPFPFRTGGFGGIVTGTLPVVPGQTLYVYVGGNGEESNGFSQSQGGANGGGASGPGGEPGGGAAGGGGASDLRTIPAPTSGSQTTSLESRVLVAAGGGGGAPATNAGSPGNGDGGNAEEPGNSTFGGEPAFPGVANPNGTGEGGEGGSAETSGENGSLGNGGAGGGDCCFEAGGGGAGLYGGGGGSSFYGQPGAGGASWVEQSATGASIGPIDGAGHPHVTISYEPPQPAPTPVSAPVTPVVTPLAPPPIAPTLTGLKPLHRCASSVVLGQPTSGGSGLTFSFTLSQTSNVVFAVLHRVGSPAWSKCPRVRGHAPGSYHSMGQLSGVIPAGNAQLTMGTAARTRHVRFQRRLGRGRHSISLANIAAKRLPPGTYVLSAKAVNSTGQSSGVSYAKFWVIR
jgi:hypothetical protein